MELLTMSTLELTRLAAMERLARGEVTQVQVSLQLGLSVRQVKRLWRRFLGDGTSGLQSRRRGKPSNRRFDPGLLRLALDLVREHYLDFGPTFAAEKLLERHDLRIDHETLRRAMIAADLWKPSRRRRARIHPPRERRPCFGELVQIDGSHHPWFEQRGPKCTLYVDVDDATSSILALHFAEQETTEGYFALLRQHILEYGLPLSVYTDQYGVFRINKTSSPKQPTQFGRAMRQLDIELICANSPQAKGRVERINGTLQKRLVRELRLRNICTIAGANEYAPEFITDHNARFAKLPIADDDAHRPAPPLDQLDRILCRHYLRTVSKNLTVQIGDTHFQLLVPEQARRLQHTLVTLRYDRFGQLFIERNGDPLPYRIAKITPRTAVLSRKELANRRVPNPKKAHTPSSTHPWKLTYHEFARGGHH